ncbi:MAG: sigma 54-interacting transcriptional regulator [Polyangiales bacterium]
MQDKTTARADASALQPVTDERARVIVLGPQGAKQFVVTEAGAVIGRAFPAEIVVDDPSVSKQHLRVWLASDGTVRFADLGSTNGTTLNGLAVPHGTFARGDTLRIGSVQLQLQPSSASVLVPGVLAFDSFVQRFAEEQRAHWTSAQPFSVLVVESQSTVALREWAPKVLGAIGAKDRAAQLRDDALVVLLSGARRSEARSIASAIAQGDGGLRVGAATYPEQGRDISSLVTAATAASAEPSGATIKSDGIVRGESTDSLWAMIDRAAPSVVPVMVLGESGTGKELVAQALHQRSARGDKPLRAVNCGAIPANLVESTLFGAERGAFTGADRTLKGLFEQAHGGTLFLDEVGELPLPAQASLLRVLETSKVTRIGGDREISVDVRIVSATHRDLERRCHEGTFRWDLYYRLNGLSLELPPLRERRDEIEPLVALFLEHAQRNGTTAVRGVHPKALEALRNYGWPGNIRELRNCVQRAALVANGPVIVLDDLTERVRTGERAPSSPPSAAVMNGTLPPPGLVPSGVGPSSLAVPSAPPSELDEGEGLRKALEKHEIKLITEALAKAGGSTSGAAAILQIPIRTLTHKINALGIKKSKE